MSRVVELLQELRREWSQPREAIHRGEPSPFPLACSFGPPISDEAEIESLPVRVSRDLRDIWHVAQRAELFKDKQYGQWGIEILSPTDAAVETERQRRERARDFHRSDLVVGRFFGDSDLLVLRCEERSADYGSIRVALPIDPRADWPTIASTFDQFLERLIEAQGDKYWETRSA
jgi:hypothetical protein